MCDVINEWPLIFRSGSTVSKKAEMKKRKAKNLIKLEQKATPEYGQSINPISRLIQIQQAKKEKEPVYTLIAEKGMPRRREFIMQVMSIFLSLYLLVCLFLGLSILKYVYVCFWMPMFLSVFLCNLIIFLCVT